MGGYFSLYLLFKATRRAPAITDDDDEDLKPQTQVTDDIPSVFSDKFDKFSQVPGNVAKWEKSIETWEKAMEDPKYADTYSKSIA